MAIINNTIINGKLHVNGNINASVVTASNFIGALTGTASNATSLNNKAESALSVSYAVTASNATTAYGKAENALSVSYAATAGSATSATSATYASRIITTANSSNTAYYIPFIATSTSDNDGVDLLVGNSKAFTFNPSTGVVVATKFSGAFSGNATSATTANVATSVKVQNVSQTTSYLLMATACTGACLNVYANTGVKYDPTNKILIAPTFSGSFSGNATSATTAASLTTARNLTIIDNNSNSGTATAFKGNVNISIPLPTTINANNFTVSKAVNISYNSTSDCLEVVFL